MSTSDTPESINSKGTTRRLFSYETFGITATVVGFIVDSIAIASLLLAIRLDSPIILTPYHALFIWCIALFTYFCMLQIYWRRKLPKQRGTFGGFLLFYVPGNQLVLLLPLVVLILFLIWIVVELVPTLDGGVQTTLTIIAVLGGGVVSFILFGLAVDGHLGQVIRNAKFRYTLESNWKYWDKLVATRLKGHQWIGTAGFIDVIKQHKPTVATLETLLARYASVHPETAFYGILYYKDKGKRVHENYVLVNLKAVDRTKYSL